jgi:hypothetical protein
MNRKINTYFSLTSLTTSPLTPLLHYPSRNSCIAMVEMVDFALESKEAGRMTVEEKR